MGSQTPKFAFPYPVGTDRVMDGDNAMQALAEKVEALLGTTRSAVMTKSLGVTGYKPSGQQDVPQSHVNVTMTVAGVALLKAQTDITSMTGCGYVLQRIGSDDATQGQWFETTSAQRCELLSLGWLYLPAGVTNVGVQIGTFANGAAGLSLNTCRWSIHAVGGTPSIA